VENNLVIAISKTHLIAPLRCSYFGNV